MHRTCSARPDRPSAAAPGPCRRWALAALAVAACLAASCAGAGSERVLSPLFSSHSAAGGVLEIEALGGSVVTRREPETGRREYWAVRPLVSNRYRENGDRYTWVLPPLGFSKLNEVEGRRLTQIIPFVRYASQIKESGFRQWTLMVFPLLWLGKYEDGRVQKAFFPFFGRLEKFLSLDRGTFVLFPLWLRTERYGRTNDHFLWPFFTWGRGTGGKAWRVWPIAGNISWDGRYNRWFFLWPFFHWQRNDIQYGQDQTQGSWLVWPLVGKSRRGPATAYTALWPFFGHTKDPNTGFWAWDGPFPLVRFQGGDENRAVRKRVWPFYSYFNGDGYESRWIIWPIYNRSRETYDDGTRKGTLLFPIWRSYTRQREYVTPASAGPLGTERYRKLWPVGKIRVGPGIQDLHVIDLNPFPDYQFIDEHYAWLWELYTRHANGQEVRSRSWLGLWRREKDADEDRRTLSVLWSARDYTRAGRRAHERSLLLGLIRYRTVEGGGFTLLRPAIPGPGWPMRRTPSSMSPEIGSGPRKTLSIAAVERRRPGS
ncbi:MAG: hypothetical protein AAF957_13570 [Planctomycetota bacterium]